MTVTIHVGDCRQVLLGMPADSIDCCITSPPYFNLRDYGMPAQIGIEATPDAYVAALVGVFAEVRRVLKPSGSLWLNIGDSYDKNTKQLRCIPWKAALAIQADGWILRQDVVWAKPAPMPESIKDRCTRSHEYLFHFVKTKRYFYDAAAVAEPSVMKPQARNTLRSDHPKGDAGRAAHRRPPGGAHYEKRNKRSVWTISTPAYKGAHFAIFPEKLVEPCILSSCPINGSVLDPFGGVGTAGLVASRLGRSAILIELNSEYADAAGRRIKSAVG